MKQKALEYYSSHFNQQKGQKYPCSNQNVICGIITNDRHKALEFMKDKDIVKKRDNKNEIEWILSNGECWSWHKWNYNCHGYRFYKIAVDENIEEEFFQEAIFPICDLYCCSMEII